MAASARADEPCLLNTRTVDGSAARIYPLGLDFTRTRIHEILDGDRAALTELVCEVLASIKVEVAVSLFRRARSQGRDPRQEVNDFSHEILISLLADRGRVLRLWDPERGHSLAGFVRMITRQRLSRILQGHRGNPWGDEPTDDAALEPLLEPDANDRILESREELRILLERLRARLSERGYLLFCRIYVDQRPIIEVAAEFGMTRQAVDAWNTRARNLARRLAAEINP